MLERPDFAKNAFKSKEEEAMFEQDKLQYFMLVKSLEYEQAELYMINNKYDKALIIVDSLLETMRERDHNNAAMSKEFNSLPYIFLLKKKYTCLLKVVETQQNIYSYFNR
jgi:hypothetical protein